jgi:hypothetical protein
MGRCGDPADRPALAHEAAEFNNSGTQAVRALREEATVYSGRITDNGMSGRVAGAGASRAVKVAPVAPR